MCDRGGTGCFFYRNKVLWHLTSSGSIRVMITNIIKKHYVYIEKIPPYMSKQ